MNCRLVSYHSLSQGYAGYEQEDKWTFLITGRDENIPVTPFLDMEAIVLKNKLIEGGMGIHFYKVK
jgi:hypothetical protein